MKELTLVAGLGNPGDRYDGTRHNVGFAALDVLAARHGIRTDKLKHKAYLGEGSIGGSRVLLVKPQTYMNLSGESVREIAEWYKIPSERIIILYDDIDLDTGKLRVRPKGSAGTHNGMRSMLYQLQTDGFPRVRIGVGKPPAGWDLADYVLSRFRPEEKEEIEGAVKRAADAVEVILSRGVEAAMNSFNQGK